MGCSSCSSDRKRKINLSMNNYQNNPDNQEKNTKIYTTEEVNNLYNNFNQKIKMAETFLDKESKDDPVFNTLKQEEKKILDENFHSQSEYFIKEFSSKFKKINIPLNNNKELVSEFIQKEDGDSAFQYKIGECIKKITRNKEEY